MGGRCTTEELKRLPQIGISALFDHEKLVLYLDKDINYTVGEHRGSLVHELTHYVQALVGKFKRYCQGILEREAYDLEDKWRLENGFPPLQVTPARIFAEMCVPGPT